MAAGSSAPSPAGGRQRALGAAPQSAAFQQVKQTQASLARLSRGQQLASSQSGGQSSQQQPAKEAGPQLSGQPARSTSFVDCLIRRFKDCFNEDCCTVPMFVVGHLSPGSDGTHLILPPCVSLGRQSISRFAGPKNQRLMNSIRESCRSIEELDLGGNRLTDLIEIYKILQCTPNLRFLNLSGNDLSRSSPVAMAAPCQLAASPLGWCSSSTALNQRTCLAPINQNAHSLGARRHSTLGQLSGGGATSQRARLHATPSRVADARRLAAATSAVAQSNKTSPMVASKLAGSSGALVRQTKASAGAQGGPRAGRSAAGGSAGGQRHQAAATSTMQLARSLSSLSAKDGRSAGSAIHRLAACKEDKSAETKPAGPVTQTTGKQQVPAKQTSDGVKLTPERAPFAEPIEEADDVDMNEPPAASTSAGHTEPEPSQQPAGQSKALAFHTSTSLARQSSASQSANFRRTFESIKALALNNTGCQWRVVCSILSRMPNLEELHLSLNNYERIDLDPNEFKHPTLRRLYLCNNPKLTSWHELDKLLLAFPSLEALSIADCSISQIPDDLGRAREWRKLCGLNINGWPIKEWPVVERLNQLPSLVDLKCRNLALLSTIDEPRHHLIARLPKLQRLNGSEIEEREHAEKAFLRFFMANAHLERPRRFHELVQIHGEVAPVDVDVDLSPPSQARVRVIYLNRNHYRKENEDDVLMSEDFLTRLMDDIDGQQQETGMEVGEAGAAAPSDSEPVRLFKDDGQEVLAIDVDLRQSVRKFKATVAQIFGLDGQKLVLYYIDSEMVGLMGPELIKHDQKKLWNYNVQDGDQFIVEES